MRRNSKVCRGTVVAILPSQRPSRVLRSYTVDYATAESACLRRNSEQSVPVLPPVVPRALPSSVSNRGTQAGARQAFVKAGVFERPSSPTDTRPSDWTENPLEKNYRLTKDVGVLLLGQCVCTALCSGGRWDCASAPPCRSAGRANGAGSGRDQNGRLQTSCLKNILALRLLAFVCFRASGAMGCFLTCPSHNLRFHAACKLTQGLRYHCIDELSGSDAGSALGKGHLIVNIVTRCYLRNFHRCRPESGVGDAIETRINRRRAIPSACQPNCTRGCRHTCVYAPHGKIKPKALLAQQETFLCYQCCTTWRTVTRRKKLHDKHETEEGRLPHAFPFCMGNAVNFYLRPFLRFSGCAVKQQHIRTGSHHPVSAHRTTTTFARSAALLASKLGKKRSRAFICRNVRVNLPSPFTTAYYQVARSEALIWPFGVRSYGATVFNTAARTLTSSPGCRTRPNYGTLKSGKFTVETSKQEKGPGDGDFLRGAGAAWNVCAESDWKSYSQEQLLSTPEKVATAGGKRKEDLEKGTLYNVQRFPAEGLASLPTSGRLRAEQTRLREVYWERTATEEAAAGAEKGCRESKKLERERYRRLTWRDYLSWLPSPELQYHSPHIKNGTEIKQGGKAAGVLTGDEACGLTARRLGEEKDVHDEWEGFPPHPSTQIDDLSLGSLVANNETIVYRQAFEGAPMVIDEETFRRLRSSWTDAEELKRVQREEKALYGIQEDVPDECWIPISPTMPEGRLVQDYGLIPNVTRTAAGYDYIETYHDPARNYTWSYKRWNPFKQEGEPPRNLKGGAESTYELETEKSTHYWHEEPHPPRLKLDDGIFRQPTIAEEMIQGTKRTPLGMDQWHYTPMHPLGQAAELQNFWLTAVKRTLPEAKAQGADEAAAAADAACRAQVSRFLMKILPSSQVDPATASEQLLAAGLPLWVCCPPAKDAAATSSKLPRVAVPAGEVSAQQHLDCDAKKIPPAESKAHAAVARPEISRKERPDVQPPGHEMEESHQAPDATARFTTTRLRAAAATDPILAETATKLCTPPESSVSDSKRPEETQSKAKLAAAAQAPHRKVVKIFDVRRSAYQPLATYTGEDCATETICDMKYRQLGKSDIFVSEVGLGTMTVGSPQLDESRTRQLLSYAIDVWGVNFIDTAELYPLPAASQTYGRAEEIIGRWLCSTRRRTGRRREELVIATKVAGPSSKLAWLRNGCNDSFASQMKPELRQPAEGAGNGQPGARAQHHPFSGTQEETCAQHCTGVSTACEATSFSKTQILQAAEGSLRRLQTNYIDLLQLHWPDRYVPMQISSDAAEVLYDPQEARFRRETRESVSMEEQLDAVEELLRQGKVRRIHNGRGGGGGALGGWGLRFKQAARQPLPCATNYGTQECIRNQLGKQIRAWGLSNETPYGVCRFTQLATKRGLPPPAGVQLHYNLLCRNDVEKGFVELARPQNAGIGLLAYGALAGGILTGKYLEWLEKPTTGRLLRFPSYMKRYRGSLAARAVTAYYYLALRLGHPNLTVMALRWALTRPFICSTLLGFTDYYQLREILHCIDPICGVISDCAEREINFIHWKWRDAVRVIQ